MWCGTLLLASLASLATAAPSFTTLNSTEWRLSNGDAFEMTINSKGYAYSMKWNQRELVGNATGGYTDFGGRTTFNFTSAPEVIDQTNDKIHVAFESYFGVVHYILYSGLNGHYQYVVNKNLAPQGEVRSLYRLDPLLFTDGRTQCKDEKLPVIADIQSGLNIQDETWQRKDGSYITKYDFSCFSRGQQYHGVHGKGLGAWIIAPGLDYYIGDHMKQELMVHRETKTNDAVMLHYFHGESQTSCE
jgi:rhamnogalacturonan endolyase